MPALTRTYLKCALLWLVAALAAWALQALGPLTGGRPEWAALGPTAVHLFVVGWLTQLIFGIVSARVLA